MQEIFEKIKERLKDKKDLVPVNRLLDDIINEKPLELGQLMAYEEAIEIVNKVAEEYKQKAIIDGNGCWQSCACTEKCKECQRYTLNNDDIDWYENIDDWTS